MQAIAAMQPDVFVSLADEVRGSFEVYCSSALTDVMMQSCRFVTKHVKHVRTASWYTTTQNGMDRAWRCCELQTPFSPFR